MKLPPGRSFGGSEAMELPRLFGVFLYVAFLVALCFVCFKKPIPEEFDRYVYESIARTRRQTVQTIYPIVKHSSPRAEASSIMDSPEHLGQLEPLYAIRPLYLEAIAIAADAGIPYQPAISLISVASLFLIGVTLLWWTGRPLYSALLLASPAVVGIARSGTPDALAALFLVTSVWALTNDWMLPGLSILLASVWVRTDNLLFVLTALIWLMWRKKLSPVKSAALAGLAAASVLAINYFSGNYGWSVLFRYTFVGGRYIAYVPPDLKLSEYVSAVASGIRQIGNQEVTLFLLVGLAAFKWLPKAEALRSLLVVVAAAALLRFALFPNPENRYFAWAYLITGTAFIRALSPSVGLLPSFHKLDQTP